LISEANPGSESDAAMAMPAFLPPPACGCGAGERRGAIAWAGGALANPGIP
jgi:hypothetical protein